MRGGQAGKKMEKWEEGMKKKFTPKREREEGR